MGVSVKVSGDPRRPNECHEFKQLPPTVEDSTPAALLMFSIGFGVASFLLKIKAFGWAGLLCALVSLANTTVQTWTQRLHEFIFVLHLWAGHFLFGTSSKKVVRPHKAL